MSDELPTKLSDAIQKALEDAYKLGCETMSQKSEAFVRETAIRLAELEAIVHAAAELPIRDVRGRNVCPCCDLETRGDRDECSDDCLRARARKALGLDSP